MVAQSSQGGAAHLTIVQSDGTLAKIPAWMTKEGSADAVISRDPTLLAAALLEVRAMLDRSVRLQDGESPPDSGGENDSDQSSSTASVRCHPGSHNDPAGSPTASCDADESASERSRSGQIGHGRAVCAEGGT